MHRFLAAFLVFTSAMTAVAAQTVWNVPPPDIQSVINQASPGDVLVLTAGGAAGQQYSAFNLNKGLTILGNGCTVGYWLGSPVPQGSMVVNVPAGQVAHLVGLDYTESYTPFGSAGNPFRIQGGSVRIENCTLSCGWSAPALDVVNADVVVVRSTITGFARYGGPNGLRVSNGSVTLRDCTVTGSNAGYAPYPGCTTCFFPAAAAAVVTNATLHAERTTFTGGSYATAANGIEVVSGSVWLAGCTVTGGSGAVGGTALLVSGSTPVELKQTQLVPGSPGGGASSGPVTAGAPLLTAALAPRWTRGAISTLTISGSPNALHGVFLTPAIVPVTLPIAVEPVWDSGAIAVYVGLLDALGVASYPIAVPNVVALRYAPVWCQAVSGSTLPLRASTLAGGIVQ